MNYECFDMKWLTLVRDAGAGVPAVPARCRVPGDYGPCSERVGFKKLMESR